MEGNWCTIGLDKIREADPFPGPRLENPKNRQMYKQDRFAAIKSAKFMVSDGYRSGVAGKS